MRFRRKGKGGDGPEAASSGGSRLVEEDVDGQTHVFALAGFEDEELIDQFRAALRRSLESGKTRLAVDLSATSVIGIETGKLLLGAREWVEPSGGKVVVVFPASHQFLETMFASSGLDSMLPVLRTRAEALRLLAGG